MRDIKIIHKYIFKELLSPFAISLFFLTFVFLMTRIPEITNMVVNFNADLFSIIMMMVYTLPRFLEFTIPMSVMISILLTFMRMSQENEIVALKGSGASLYTLLPPVFIFCLCGVVLTMWVTVFGVSWGRLSMKMKTVELARSSIDAALQERQFNSDLDDIMIYVSAVDMKTKELKDVFIEDRRTKGLVSISIAPEGRLIRFDDNQIYTIKLNNGVINQVDIEDNSVTHIRFGEYDINIDLGQMNQKNDSPVAKELKERNLTDLVRFIRSGHGNALELSAALMQLHEKFAVPFACITLGILAFSLGVQAASIRRASGFSLGIFFFLLYYFLLAVGWSFGETGDYPPAVGMWMPNVIMGSIAVFFLIRNAKEKPVVLPDFFQMAIDLVKRQQRKKA
ncbi:MAG: LPS export ABC transporter permease LptF [Proteobacteria bacterium]|nr:LPS export ABC transporter permease LptF [Pseudomonadota bacterium]MBU1389657.1 LPS export ABC transporter permease LptF [Pseudomonadota bacterium]MBU1542595.1 LPS export ABC transporter permease LptF [Pseudomonadota bacterium]MBU2483054.1 LPS export ABC transporter permease LptF [Pseudomonadota bacterium]